MQWIKPNFEEISLGGEVTAYVNTDKPATDERHAPTQIAPASKDASRTTFS